MCLFIYTLFKNAACTSDYVDFNGSIISVRLTLKDVKRRYRGLLNRKATFDRRNRQKLRIASLNIFRITFLNSARRQVRSSAILADVLRKEV